MKPKQPLTCAGIAVLLALLLLLSPVFSACTGGSGPSDPETTDGSPSEVPDEPTADTDPGETGSPEHSEAPTAAQTTEAVTTEEITTAFPLVTVETVTLPLADGTDRVTAEQLGLSPVYFRSDSDAVVRVSEENGSYRFTPLGTGNDTVTFYNSYGETAGVAVSNTTAGMKLTVICFAVPNSSFNALDFGARGDGVSNSTTAIQKCIDQASAAGGGTVYVPAGKYRISHLSLKPGVSLRFEGFLPDATVGYTEQIKAFAESDSVAHIVTTGASKSNFFFFNVVPNAYCTTGTSDFTISGGVYDCQAKMKMAGFACGNNITIENMIVKDNPNNHAFQIEGCTNVTLKNIMFAGYNYPATDAVLTRETIQLEATTAGAIGSNYETNPIQCKDGDYHTCKNISVIGCYFGKSDKYGSHLVALGHHSQGGGSSVDGLIFSGNVIDNPLYCGLHLLNATNVKITGNTFISDSPATAAALGTDSALISLYGKNSANTYTDDNGKKITHLLNYELPGDRNYVIEGNTITVGGGTFLRAVSVIGVSNDNNLSAVFKDDPTVLRVTEYRGKTFLCCGYVVKSNAAANITLRNNSIRVLSPIAYKDSYCLFKNVIGLTLDANQLEVADGTSFTAKYNEIPGFSGTSIVTGNDALTHKATISKVAETSVTLVCDGKKYLFSKAVSNVVITFWSDGHGEVIPTADRAGNLTLTVTPFDGYRFAGFTDSSGNPVTLTDTPKNSIGVTANFVPVN